MRYGYVVDASASRITRADFRALKDSGVQGFIQCLQTGGFSASQAQVASVAPYNLDDSLTEGLATGGYINSQPWRPVSVIVNDGKLVAASTWPYLKMVSNDMEIQGITEAQCLATTLAIEAEGKLAPAYTAWWFAERYGGMRWPWLAAPDRGGWDADYDGRPNIEPIAWGPAGIYPVGKQYKGSTIINGDTYDLNIFDLDYLTNAQGKEDDEMAWERVDIDTALSRLANLDNQDDLFTEILGRLRNLDDKANDTVEEQRTTNRLLAQIANGLGDTDGTHAHKPTS